MEKPVIETKKGTLKQTEWFLERPEWERRRSFPRNVCKMPRCDKNLKVDCRRWCPDHQMMYDRFLQLIFDFEREAGMEGCCGKLVQALENDDELAAKKIHSFEQFW